MKKAIIIVTSVIVIAAAAICCWLYFYHNHKSMDNIPSKELMMSYIEENGEGFASEKLIGYKKKQLTEVWGEPNFQLMGMYGEVWKVDDRADLIVYYDENDIIEHIKASIRFEATVLEVKESYLLVKPVEGSPELRSSDQIEVLMKDMDPSPEPQAGDIVEISYDGTIMESYPAQIRNVSSVKVTQELVQQDLIPMVMVDGMLYLDTGKESTMTGRCGTKDGYITSEVDGTQKPTENDQSNFGTGYGYQYTADDGVIEICIDDKWWVFATQEARKETEF